MSANLKLVHEDSVLDSLAQVADSIAIEKDLVEREIKRLAESGFRDEAWIADLAKHMEHKHPDYAEASVG